MDNTSRKNSDGYKPAIIPQAFKLIQGRNDRITNEGMVSMTTNGTNPKVTFYDSLQVRLVSDLEKSLAWYRDVLGCEVNYWGHALRGGMKLILQQAKQVSDIKPNTASSKRDSYPTDWEGPDLGWDTFIHTNYEEFERLVEEMKASGANIILGPIENTHSNGMTFKNLYIQDPDGYIIVFGQ